MSSKQTLFFSKLHRRLQGGHTFLELIVVISIFAIISSVLLFNFGDFSTNISVQNLASDIALTVKQAQSEAIAGKSSSLSVLTGTYAPTYGVAFLKDRPGSFFYFVDGPILKDRLFNYNDPNSIACDQSGSTVTECLREVAILTGDTITGMCMNVGQPNEACDITNVSISFQRPFPDAVIKSSDTSSTISNVAITVTSARGTQKSILVNALGQISVE